MKPGRHPAPGSPREAVPPPAPLRLALPAGGEERRRASLYRELAHWGEGDLPSVGPMAAPPLQRGRMVPERTGGQTLRGALGRLARLALRVVFPLPSGEEG